MTGKNIYLHFQLSPKGQMYPSASPHNKEEGEDGRIPGLSHWAQLPLLLD